MIRKFKNTSGKMILSDPCYELGTWSQGEVDVKKGEWVTNCELDKRDDRVARLIAYSTEAWKNNPSILEELFASRSPLPFIGGVDSGQFGYFDKVTYRDHNSVKDVKRVSEKVICEDEPFYSICCDRTLSEDGWGVIPGGVVSSSGWGDGEYTTYGLKSGNEYVAFITYFIEEDEDEDEGDEDEDEF
jgi:hypothetical protein